MRHLGERLPSDSVAGGLELLQFPPCKTIRIPESWKFLPVEFGIVGFGIRNTDQGIRNPTNDWIIEFKLY